MQQVQGVQEGVNESNQKIGGIWSVRIMVEQSQYIQSAQSKKCVIQGDQKYLTINYEKQLILEEIQHVHEEK